MVKIDQDIGSKVFSEIQKDLYKPQEKYFLDNKEITNRGQIIDLVSEILRVKQPRNSLRYEAGITQSDGNRDVKLYIFVSQISEYLDIAKRAGIVPKNSKTFSIQIIGEIPLGISLLKLFNIK